MLMLILLACIAIQPLRCGDAIELASLRGRTLPAEAYGLVQRGQGMGQLSWAWRAPDFKPEGRYAVKETRWTYPERHGRVLAYLREQLDLQAQPGAADQVSVRVVYFAIDSVGTSLILEGQVLRDGKPKAFFVENVFQGPGEPLWSLVDSFMRDLTAFLA